ncbi:hypothetical protein HPP92_016039 [Vanilla planifolia]|uniref:Pollen preferential protein n=1 Tax=Vanilla planifolia TaxID=51239 RepID=A0A835UQA9_VANPL|nr:hypothetical protein HPP92_016658 [Vanilla planifolia]KAG0471493.1 hypothetical protein HPP92_016039 [Vanilla planifolia]
MRSTRTIGGNCNLDMSQSSVAEGAPAAESPKKTKLWAEAAGGTAAGCAAVVCCLSFGIVSVVTLTAAKFPAEIGRRTVRRMKRRIASGKGKRDTGGHEEFGTKPLNSVADASMSKVAAETGMLWPSKSPAEEVSEMEKKMLPQFYGAGFWRSPSQRE